MALSLLLTGFEDIFIQCSEECFVCGSTVHNRMPGWIDEACLIWVEDFECRRQIVGQDREQVEEERSSVIRKECQQDASSVIFMNPNMVVSCVFDPMVMSLWRT
jgi:hypothetical protein